MIWLPLPSYTDSLKSLSSLHLETLCIDTALLMEHFLSVCNDDSALPPSLHWSIDNHLAAMWQGYEMQLCELGLQAVEEFQHRNIKPHNDYVDFAAAFTRCLEWATNEESDMSKPNWFGDVDVHLSHQAALVRKDPDHYKKLFRVDENMPLVWPVSRHATP